MRPRLRLIALVLTLAAPPAPLFAQDSVARPMVQLDSHRVVARRPEGRKQDRITEAEFALPDVVGRNAFDALELLRPALLRPRAPLGGGNSEAAMRGQLISRETVRGRQMADPLGEHPGAMTASVNEGPLQNIDVLTLIAARAVREMKYLNPVEATARFGVTSSGGPVLIVYTMAP